jgi:hypothetical protein
MVRLALSTTYLPRLHPSSIPDNFHFIDQRGQSNIVLAQLLSPRVAQLLSTDPTIRSVDIEVEDENDFCSFTSLVRDGRADVCEDRLSSSIWLAGELGNTELVEQLISLHPLPYELSPSNILDELKFYERMGTVPGVELIVELCCLSEKN